MDLLVTRFQYFTDYKILYTFLSDTLLFSDILLIFVVYFRDMFSDN